MYEIQLYEAPLKVQVTRIKCRAGSVGKKVYIIVVGFE